MQKWDSKFFISSDKKFATFFTDKTIYLWDLKNGKELKAINEGQGEVTSTTISSENTFIISASIHRDKERFSVAVQSIIFWDLESGRRLFSLSSEWEISWFDDYNEDYIPRSLAISNESSNGMYIVVGFGNGFIQIIKIEGLGSGKEVQLLNHENDENDWDHTYDYNPADAVVCVAISSDNRFIVSSSASKSIKLWDLQSGQELHSFEGYDDPAEFLLITNDNKFIISSHRSEIIIWDIKNGNKIRSFESFLDRDFLIDLHPDYDVLISSLNLYTNSFIPIWHDGNTIQLWNFKNGEEIIYLEPKEIDEWNLPF